MAPNTKQTGFTLIELMIVVVVIGILSAIAYPSYVEYLKRNKRAEGRAALMQAAQALERYYTANNTYPSNLSSAGVPAYSGSTSAKAAYTIAVQAGSTGSLGTSFKLSATPTNGFDDASGCGTYTLTEAGVRAVEAATYTAEKCW